MKARLVGLAFWGSLCKWVRFSSSCPKPGGWGVFREVTGKPLEFGAWHEDPTPEAAAPQFAKGDEVVERADRHRKLLRDCLPGVEERGRVILRRGACWCGLVLHVRLIPAGEAKPGIW
jgi:hypothetical protein